MMKKRLKLLFIQRDLKSGGAQRAMVFIAKLLAEDNFDCFIYTYNASVAEISVPVGIQYIPEGNPHGENAISKYVYPIFQVCKVVNRYKPDCIIAFTPSPCVAAIFGSYLSKHRVPVIVCERSDPYYENNRRFRFLRYFFRFADYGIFQTKQSQDYFKKLKRKSTIIPNPAKPVGILADKFAQRDKTISLVARLDNTQKRQDVMLKAMAILKQKYPDYKLLLYGEGPDENSLKEMTKSLGISDVVVFKGNVENVTSEVVKSQFSVLTSDFEGIPNAVIEGMSMGLTVISTDTSPGGARFLINDAVNGRIVPRGDFESIASTISYYIEHPEEADILSENAKKVTEALAPNKIKEQWINVIKEVTKNG